LKTLQLCHTILYHAHDASLKNKREKKENQPAHAGVLKGKKEEEKAEVPNPVCNSESATHYLKLSQSIPTLRTPP